MLIANNATEPCLEAAKVLRLDGRCDPLVMNSTVANVVTQGEYAG